MAQDPNRTESQREPQRPSYTPASPMKRALAWIGLVYVLIFLALTTYFYFTGRMLGNLAPLAGRPRPRRSGGGLPGELAVHRPSGQGGGHRPGGAVLASGAGHPSRGHRRATVQLLRH